MPKFDFEGFEYAKFRSDSVFILSFVFWLWGIKHRSFINDMPLPISTADSRLNYWLINTPYQFID